MLIASSNIINVLTDQSVVKVTNKYYNFYSYGYIFWLFGHYNVPVLKLNKTNWLSPYLELYVYLFVDILRPSQPNGVMSGRVSLPNHTFTGQA